MMRMKSGIFCALAVGAAFAFSCADSPSTGGDGQQGSGQTTNNVCGDGTCATSEIGYCPTDCGSGGGNNNNAVCGNGQCETTKGESASTCFSDCGGGGGSGGGNTSTLNCSDQNTQIGCLSCQLFMQCTAPYDAVSCAACGGGLGSGGLGSGFPGGGSGFPGGGSGACNFDGVCDPGEDATTCPSDCP